MSGTTIEWSFVPWRDRPALAGRAALAAVVSVLVVVAVPEAVPVKLALGAAVAALFAGSCVPQRCRLGPDGASVTTLGGTSVRRWTDIRRAELHPGGVELSPFPRRHWLEPFRDLRLPFPARPRGGGRISEQVRALLAEHGL